MFKEYPDYDGLGLAELVSKGAVSPLEILDAAHTRAQASNPRLNAICIPLFDHARAQCNRGFTGPFAGVPMAIKDAAQDYAGVPTTQGCRALRHRNAAGHSATVRRWLDAGFMILGKTATPELCLKGVTESKLWGPTRNPWNHSLTPGGSSGGSAAAVAARIVPIAGASDGGGSIRIPASFCGLFGLRPSRGRVSVAPVHGEIWEGASSEHVLTRSVRDSAAVLDLLATPQAGDPFIIRPPEGSFLDAARRTPGKLRIGYSNASPLHASVHPDCVLALENAVKLLRSLGHEVEPAAPVIDGLALAHSYLTMYFGQVAATIAEIQALTGAADSDFEEDTRALAKIGQALSAGEYVRERRRWNEYARALGEFHNRFDLYLTPTVAAPAARIHELSLNLAERTALQAALRLPTGKLLQASGLIEQTAMKNLIRTPFTQLSNLTGTPSMSVPLFWNNQNMPVGVQFIAPFGDEARLFSLAGQLEQAQSWHSYRPAL